jgi:hypothetical protein
MDRAASRQEARMKRLVALFACIALAPSCARTPAPPPDDPSVLRRLSTREIGNVVRDLTGEALAADRFLEETYDTGYDDGPLTLTMQTDEAGALERSANDLAQTLVGAHPERLLGVCVPDRDGAGACAQAFISGFATRAFRRPLRPEEARRLGDLIDGVAKDAGFSLALEIATTVVLESAPLLYRSEIGEDAPGGARLTPAEAASALSFFVAGTMPDDALVAAASSGRLATGDDRRREAARLLGTPAARDAIRAFVLEWLGLTGLTSLGKDPALYPEWSPDLASAMEADLEQYVDASLWEADGSLARLFGSTVAFVDAGLAAHYGVPAGPTPMRVDLDPSTRRGVLTRAGFLAAHAAYDSSGPIARGVFVRSALLCASPPPPPPNISRAVPVVSGRTTRERFADHTSNPFCQGCHKAIDGVGFGFEEFDGTGKLRADEGGEPIDATGLLALDGEPDAPFVGAPALEDLLVGSPRFSACFVKQLVRFAFGRAEAPDDQPLLDRLGARFDAHRRVTDLVLDLVADDSFVARRRP